MSIHWLMAFCFLILFTLGVLMVRLPEGIAIRNFAYATHKSFGVLILWFVSRKNFSVAAGELEEIFKTLTKNDPCLG